MPELNTIQDKISPLIKEQFPDVYKNDGELMTLFVKAYYEYIEQEDEALGLSRNMASEIDVDQATASFLEHFKKTYLFSIPETMTIDQSFVIKHILDLYRSKGSKRALQLFFKLIYGKNADLFIPNEHLAKASDATFVTPRYIEIFAGEDEIQAFLGNEITGQVSGATAFVTSIVDTSVQGKALQIVYLERLVGEFIRDELVFDPTGVYFARTNGSLSAVTLTDGGNSYSVGQELTVKSKANTSTVGRIRVTGVANGTGVPAIELQIGGSGYSANNSLSNVIISETILEVNNISNTAVSVGPDGSNTVPANTFQIFEEIFSPRVAVTYTSGDNIFAQTANSSSYVQGINSTAGVIANGHIAVNARDSASSTNGTLTIYETSGSFAAENGVVKLKFAGDATVNADFGTFTNNYPTGTFIGRRANNLGITANSGVWPVEPQGFVKGAVTNTVADIVANRSGANANVLINAVGNAIATNVYTDFIKFTNSGNVLSTDMLINGSNSNVTAAGYGFPKNTTAGIDDVIDKALTFETSELLGEVTSLTVVSSGNSFTADPIVMTQNRFVDSFFQKDVEIGYRNRAGTTPEVGDMYRQYKAHDTRTLTFSTNTANDFSVGEGVKQVINSSTNTYAQVRSITNTTHMVLGGLYTSNTTAGAERLIGDNAVINTSINITGLLTGATINTITATSNTSENTVALAKVLASNTSNNYLKMRMHSIEFDYFVSSTTSERLQSNNNNRSFEIVTIDDATNNYNRFVKAGVNANTFANVTIGTGLITNAEVIYSGLGFKDGELLDFTLGTNAQAVVGTATANGTGIGVGYTKLNSGVLGEKFSIHDNSFFQQFSYEVLSEFELNKYERILKEVVHTAGYKLFGRPVVDTFNNVAISVANSAVSQA